MLEYYVIAAYRPRKEEQNLIVLVGEITPRKAHDAAIAHFRKKNRLRPDIHIATRTLFRDPSEDKCKEFMKKLDEKIEEGKPNESE